jgi:hydroxymethylglutaryl-CoA lyase
VEGPVTLPRWQPGDLPAKVTIREVGPRDGLQSEQPLPAQDRAQLITRLSRTGLPKIEAVSFVSSRAVPAMADAAGVWAQVERSSEVEYSALVPNRRGAEAAVRAGGFSSIQAFLAASDGYNRHNVGKPVEESLVDVRDVVEVGTDAGVAVECAISCSFGDPFDGDVPPRRVLEVAEQLAEAGVVGVSLADTTGMATPTRVWDLVPLVRDRLPELRLNLHFHDTRGTALANVLAAIEVGCDEFDSSIGGLGGSPFAPGANGNVATEDLVHMLTDMDVETGVKSLEELLDVAGFVERLVGHGLRSQVSKAGPRWSSKPPPEAER